MIVNVDLEKLDAMLSTIGWDRSKMEDCLRITLSERMEAVDKKEMWIRIRAAKKALMLLKPWFPDATVDNIREMDSQS